jgi:hypothetical protein
MVQVILGWLVRKNDTRRERGSTKTTLSLAPLTVDEVLSAMLKTPPPPLRQKPEKKKRTRKAKR